MLFSTNINIFLSTNLSLIASATLLLPSTNVYYINLSLSYVFVIIESLSVITDLDYSEACLFHQMLIYEISWTLFP